MLKDAGIVVVPFDTEMADTAFQAFRRCGKGRGYPAQLNIIDCAVYGLAKVGVNRCSLRVAISTGRISSRRSDHGVRPPLPLAPAGQSSAVSAVRADASVGALRAPAGPRGGLNNQRAHSDGPLQQRTTAMRAPIDAIPQASGHEPWNKGKSIGAKPPLRPKHVWSIRAKLQVSGRTRATSPCSISPSIANSEDVTSSA